MFINSTQMLDIENVSLDKCLPKLNVLWCVKLTGQQQKMLF